MSNNIKMFLSILTIFSDIIICGLFGLVMMFIMFFFNGCKSENLMIYGPSVMTQTAVMHCYFARVLGAVGVKKLFKKNGKWICFMFYYVPVWIVAYASVHAVYNVLKDVWYKMSSGFQGMIALHQVLTFVTLTSHNSWFDGYLLKDVSPMAAATLQFFVTWIVWGIWVHHAFSEGMNNMDQMGGYIQWIPLTNLMNASIFKDLDLSKSFKNIGTRFGYLAFITNVVNFICWIISYGFTAWIFPKDWKLMSSAERGSSIWQMSAMSWLGFQILGHRLSPFIFKKYCLFIDKRKNWIAIPIYFICMLILAILLEALFYYYFNAFLYDIIACKVLGYAGNDKWYLRPMYFFGFGVGTAYICHVETEEMSKDWIEEEKHDDNEYNVHHDQPYPKDNDNNNNIIVFKKLDIQKFVEPSSVLKSDTILMEKRD